MNARTIRRAIEMKARKEARKQARQQEVAALSAPTLNTVEGSESAENPLPVKPPSAIQIEANRRNAQLSTGPKTAEGKAISSKNNFKHGFCGAFQVLESESQQQFDDLLATLRKEHQASTPSEDLLVEGLAQHFWLSQRAMNLQTMLLSNGHLTREAQKTFALYMRYQATHDRGFFKCLNELLKLRAEKRKAEIGFELQKLKLSADLRRQEAHDVRVRIAITKAECLEARKRNYESASNSSAVTQKMNRAQAVAA